MVVVSDANTLKIEKNHLDILSTSARNLITDVALFDWCIFILHYAKILWFSLRICWGNIVSEKKMSSQRFLGRDFYLHFLFSFGRRTYDLVPFDRTSLLFFFFTISEHKCPVDEREQLEETLPLILGLILGLVIVVTLAIYHIHHKMTANQVQIPRDRSQYKHMG